jgi:hypothetical protein
MLSYPICESVGEFNFRKSPSADGSMCHSFGDMVLTKETPLNRLLQKYRFLHDSPIKYLGEYEHRIAIFNDGAGREERFDTSDVVAGDVENLVAGERYTVSVTKWEKEVAFMRYEDGPFYKWQTQNGFMLIFNQADVDSLSEKDKRTLHIIK